MTPRPRITEEALDTARQGFFASMQPYWKNITEEPVSTPRRGAEA